MKAQKAAPTDRPSSGFDGVGFFPDTAWSMLHQAQGEIPQEALAAWERLALAYWQPLYAFLRRRGVDHHAACDDVQGFFAHLISRDSLRKIERGNGLFRSYLLASLQHWRTDQYRNGTALKRGGGRPLLSLEEMETAGTVPMAENATPEEVFDRRWARTVFQNAIATLHSKQKARGREPVFLKLQGLLTGQGTGKYAQIALELRLTEGAIKQAALDLRKEFGRVLRDEIRRTVSDEALLDGEIRYLLGLLRK